MCLFSSCRCSSQLPPLLLQPQLPHTEPEQASAATPPQQPRPHHQGECHLWYLRRKLHASLQLKGSNGRNMSFGQSATAGYVFRGLWNHMIPKRVDAVGPQSSFGFCTFATVYHFSCLTEHQQPAVLQCEERREGETRSVWSRDQCHSACRLETPRASQRLRSV